MSLIERVEAAVEISTYGTIDGGHHKMWVIDQMVRLLLGEQYTAWRDWYEQQGWRDWDEGIAP